MGCDATGSRYQLSHLQHRQQSPVELLRYIEVLEAALGRKAGIHFISMQPGDVPETMADVSELSKAVGFQPATPVEFGGPAVRELVRAVLWNPGSGFDRCGN